MTTKLINPIEANERADALLTLIAENNLISYVEQAWEHVDSATYRGNWHIDTLSDELQNFVLGLTSEMDLVVNIPPGFMKSLLLNVFLPTWTWGPLNKPDMRWFFASYSSELTTRDSLNRRYLMQSEWYQSRWGNRFSMAMDQDRKTRFTNNRGGYMMASSVGGGGLGEHPHFICVDDAAKADEAQSDVERENVNVWWDHTICLRGWLVGARRIVISQRLHEDDLPGHVLKQSNVKHICFPMRYEPDHPFPCKLDRRTRPGELLWPLVCPDSKVQELETRLGQMGAAAQLQQRPSPAGGGLFKREYFRYYADADSWYVCIEPDGKMRKILKDNCWRFIMADTAMTEKTTSDYTVRMVWDVEKIETSIGTSIAGGRMFLVDLWRERATVPEVMRQFRTDFTRWRPLFFGVEDKVSGTGIIQQFKEEGLPVKGVKADNDKVARARSAEVLMSNGRVYFPKQAPWLSQMEAELLSFPMAEHDDVPDCLSHTCAEVLRGDAWAPREEAPAVPGTYGALLVRDDAKDEWQKERAKVWKR